MPIEFELLLPLLLLAKHPKALKSLGIIEIAWLVTDGTVLCAVSFVCPNNLYRCSADSETGGEVHQDF